VRTLTGPITAFTGIADESSFKTKATLSQTLVDMDSPGYVTERGQTHVAQDVGSEEAEPYQQPERRT
jgi:hypothetical protein